MLNTLTRSVVLNLSFSIFIFNLKSQNEFFIVTSSIKSLTLSFGLGFSDKPFNNCFS
jgi:hypothetical protein